MMYELTCLLDSPNIKKPLVAHAGIGPKTYLIFGLKFKPEKYKNYDVTFLNIRITIHLKFFLIL